MGAFDCIRPRYSSGVCKCFLKSGKEIREGLPGPLLHGPQGLNGALGLMSVTEDVVKILQNLKDGGVLGIPMGCDEGEGRLKTLPFQAGGDIDESVPVRA